MKLIKTLALSLALGASSAGYAATGPIGFDPTNFFIGIVPTPLVTVGAPTGNRFENVRFGSQTNDFMNGQLLSVFSTTNISVLANTEVLLGASVFGSATDFIRFQFSDVDGLTVPTTFDLQLSGCAIITGGGFNCTQRVTFSELPRSGTISVDLLATAPDYFEGGQSRNGATFAFNATDASVTAAVPEPATWAMMIGGFGMVGGAMRSARRKQRVSVSYA